MDCLSDVTVQEKSDYPSISHKLPVALPLGMRPQEPLINSLWKFDRLDHVQVLCKKAPLLWVHKGINHAMPITQDFSALILILWFLLYVVPSPMFLP